MITLTRCTVTGEGDELEEYHGATIVASGESPNATIAISTFDRKTNKFRRADRLVHATIRGTGKNWTIEGESEILRDEVKTDDTKIRYQVLAAGGCQGCP